MPEPPALPDDVPQDALACPSTPTALPQTVTGACTGALTSVRCPAVGWVPEVARGAGQLALAWPSTPTALPHTVTGACTGALTHARPAGWVAEVPAGVAVAVLVWWLSTDTALPLTVTGAMTGIRSVLPCCAGWLVPSAAAMPDPRTHTPPMKMPACRHRLVSRFMELS